MHSYRCFMMVVGLSIISILGCGGGKASVSGKVTFNGKPLVSGTVVYVNGDRIAMGEIQSDGRYLVTEIPSGDCKISVGSPNPNLSALAKESEKGGRGIGLQKGATLPKAPKAEVTGWFPIPEKYSDPDNSGLKKTLKPGENTHNIELQ